MAITINGSGTVTGISAGGLPDDCITTADIAAGAVTQAKRSEQLTLGTSQASTSGTFIDFTGIPSWVKRVTVMFDGVSTSGTSVWQLQFGSGSIDVTGYTGRVYAVTSNTASLTSGIALADSLLSTELYYGSIQLQLIGSNTWIAAGQGLGATSSGMYRIVGRKALTGTLDRLRITTVNGTDTFDAGSINILYE